MSRRVAVGAILGFTALCGCGGKDGEVIVGLLPSKMVIVGGNGQAATIGHPLPLPLSVVVTNSDGSPASDVTVKWQVTLGGGTLSESVVQTGNGGVASATWTLGKSTGAQSVTAKAAVPTGSPANFSATGRPLPMVLHYNGSAWNMMLLDTSNVGALLDATWGAGPSNMFAVGTCGGIKLIMRYDGNAWTVPPASCAGGGFIETYTSVWGNSASDVFAVRQHPQAMLNNTAIDHYDGQTWTQTYFRGCSFCGLAVRAVWTGAAGSAIAVGDSGKIVRYDGASWNPETSGTTAHLRAVWGAGPAGPVFAVGDGGTIILNSGTGWSAQTSGTSQPLYTVWGTSSSDVFAAGGAGTILHYNGTAWTPQTSGSTQALYALWGISGSLVLAVGDAGTILRYDGSNWTAQAANVGDATIDLRGIWGTSPSNIFAVGPAK